MKRLLAKAGLIMTLSLFLSVTSYGTTLPPSTANVTLDGVEVRDYTYEQLLTVFKTIEEQRRDTFRLQITVGEKSFEYDSDDLGWQSDAVEMVDAAWALRTPEDLKTTATFDWAKVQEVVQEVWEESKTDPQPAYMKSFDTSSKEFTFSNGKPGQVTDYETCRELIYAACSDAEDGRSKKVNIPITPIESSVKISTLKEQYGLLGQYTTTTTNVPNRNTNIALCSKALSGTTLRPGEVFSFNNLLGWTSAEKGYKVAGVLVNGKPSEGLGGGICQVSSTLYNAVDKAGLTIVERHAHSATVGYVPVGRDATVSYGSLDFRFKNSTSDMVYILINYSNNNLTASVYGKK